MVNDSIHTTTASHDKSELDKFRIFYEFVTEDSKRSADKTPSRSMQRNRKSQ